MADSFQTNQACSPHPHASSDGRLPQSSGCTLWCLIGGDREPFKVVLSLNANTDVDDLKQVIHTKGIATKSSVLPKDLILWKLTKSEPLEPDDTFARRVAVKFSNPSEVATKLGPSQKLSALLPQRVPQGCLHIMVQQPTNADLLQDSLKRSNSTASDDNQPSKKSRTFGPDNTLDPSQSDFSSLVRSGAFVDKSFALRDFLLLHGTPMHLLLRPRRSGKTTLLGMFRDFLELTNPKEQARRRELFNNLNIAKEEVFESNFGKYLVIYLDFSTVTGDTMEELRQKFKRCVTNVVQQLEVSGHFENLFKLDKYQQKWLDTILNGTIADTELDIVLFELTKILYVLRNGDKAIILIDEYDTPLSYAAGYPYFLKANKFFCDVFQTLLKNNKHVGGAVLIGILHLAKGSLLSGLNNILVFPLGETAEYSTACMFTEDETRALYDRQNKILPLSFEFDQLQKWYNGYRTLEGVKLFNPWSISNSLTRGILGPWWNKSGYDQTIQTRIAELLSSEDGFRAKCQDLLDDEQVNIELVDMDYSSFPKMSAEQLWTLIYYAGYLAIASPRSLDSTRISVRIPNHEIKSEFRQWIQRDFDSRMTKDDHGTSVLLFFDMVNGYFSGFAKEFGDFLLTAMPQRIFGSTEFVYQDYLHAYFSSAASAMKGSNWNTMMEVTAGDGRSDIIIHNEEKGAILEFKRYPHKKKEGYREKEKSLLSKGTKEALDQCDTRIYRGKMPKGVTTICEYGISFLGPYCGVEARMLERVDGMWVTQREYSANDDEIRRKVTYTRVKLEAQ